jgi:hypothetical protein
VISFRKRELLVIFQFPTKNSTLHMIIDGDKIGDTADRYLELDIAMVQSTPANCTLDSRLVMVTDIIFSYLQRVQLGTDGRSLTRCTIRRGG